MKGSPVRVRASASPKALQIAGLREDVAPGPSEKIGCGQVVGRFGGSEVRARPGRVNHHARGRREPEPPEARHRPVLRRRRRGRAHALPVDWSAWREGAGLGALARTGTAVGARGLPARQPRPRAAAASRKRATGAGAAAADGTPASARPGARQVGCDRRARRRPRRSTRAAPRSATT
jgi:hypothetical protein